MNSESKFLIYQQRYKKLTLRQRTDVLIEKFKDRLLRVISTTSLKNILSPYDRFTVDKRKQNLRQHFAERIKYKEFNVDKILFFEVLDIDDFDKYKDVLISKFVDEARFKSESDKDKLRDNLANIKSSLDSIHYGHDLCSLDFNNKSYADLLDRVRVGYIKTLESYFILSIEVQPSLKFREIFQLIIDSDDHVVETIQYHKISTILKRRKFVSHTNVQLSSISESIKNLISDLNHQIKFHITDYLKGQFYKNQLLPRIEHYHVSDIDDFKKDKLLTKFIGNLKWSFKSENNKIYISLPEFRTDNDNCIKVLNEKGNGRRQEKANGNSTDYDFESYYLDQSLSLPCSLGAVLGNHYLAVRKLKRRVYDYINESSKKGFIKKFQTLKYSRDYIDLKILLAKNILLFKRFEEEFDERTLQVFLNDNIKLSNFMRTKFGNKETNEEENLEAYFQHSFNFQIENLNKKISTLEQVFRPIEEVSIYRTNFWLQIFSIGIAVLAIILTADKAFEILLKIIHWIKSIFLITFINLFTL